MTTAAEKKPLMPRFVGGSEVPHGVVPTCIQCRDPFRFGVNVLTNAGYREVQISGLCEKCFDGLFEGEDD